MRRIVIERNLNTADILAIKGSYASKTGCDTIATDCRAVDKEGNFLFRVAKNVVAVEDLDRAYDIVLPCAKHNRKRGAAAGPLTVDDLKPGQVQLNNYVKIDANGYRANKDVNSCVIGMTKKGVTSSWTTANQPVMKHVRRCIKSMNNAFSNCEPDIYAHQHSLAKGIASSLERYSIR